MSSMSVENNRKRPHLDETQQEMVKRKALNNDNRFKKEWSSLKLIIQNSFSYHGFAKNYQNILLKSNTYQENAPYDQRIFYRTMSFDEFIPLERDKQLEQGEHFQGISPLLNYVENEEYFYLNTGVVRFTCIPNGDIMKYIFTHSNAIKKSESEGMSIGLGKQGGIDTSSSQDKVTHANDLAIEVLNTLLRQGAIQFELILCQLESHVTRQTLGI